MNATQIITPRKINRRTTAALQKAFDAENGKRLITVEFKDNRRIHVIPDCEERRGFAMYFACGWMNARLS
jgi:hypothetical protein